MKIIVDHILEKPARLHAEEVVDSFPVLVRMQQDGECIFTGPVSYDITAGREFDHLRVAGTITVPVLQTCSRCLAEYPSRIESAFTVIFRKEAAVVVPCDEEIELGEQDLIASTYSGDEIDLTHEIEEQVAMEIPLKPLCSEACKGLCPTCGTDMNHGSCTCADQHINFKFSALKNFKVS